jgi:hypothetical protein
MRSMFSFSLRRTWQVSLPRAIVSAIMISSSVVLTGCQTTPPPATFPAYNPAKEGLALMPIKLQNDTFPTHQFDTLDIEIKHVASNAFRTFRFLPARTERHRSTEFWVGLPLPIGQYEIVRIGGTTEGLSANAEMSFKLTMRFEIYGKKPQYIGRLFGKVIAATKDDQAIGSNQEGRWDNYFAGLTRTTLKITAIDDYEKDKWFFDHQFKEVWAKDVVKGVAPSVLIDRPAGSKIPPIVTEFVPLREVKEW